MVDHIIMDERHRQLSIRVADLIKSNNKTTTDTLNLFYLTERQWHRLTVTMHFIKESDIKEQQILSQYINYVIST